MAKIKSNTKNIWIGATVVIVIVVLLIILIPGKIPTNDETLMDKPDTFQNIR